MQAMAAAKTKTSPLKERAIRAALDIAAAQGWDAVTFQALARKCRCTMVALNEIFEDRTDILAAYGRQIDRAVLGRFTADASVPERDRLFEILMERFDVLNDDRAAVQSILRSFCTDPKTAIISLPHLGRSMVWMLDGAGIDANGPRGSVIAIGLMGVYLYTLKTWMDDESEDMGKTMAALDKALGRAERIGQFLYPVAAA